MNPQFQVGDIVDHVGIRGVPGYAELHRGGTIRRLTPKRIVVEWPRREGQRLDFKSVKSYIYSQLRLHVLSPEEVQQ